MRDNIQETKYSLHCPIINLQIGNLVTGALVDSGSHLSCISEDFYYMNQTMTNLQIVPPCLLWGLP